MEKTGTIIASIKRATKRHYTAEEKIKIVMEGTKGRNTCYGSMPSRKHIKRCILPLEQRLS